MLKPHYFFLIIGSIFGILFLVLTPPFQVPDEINHFYRAYHIADGNLSAIKQDNRLGGFIPQSLIQAIAKNANIKGSPFTKTSFRHIEKQLQLPLEDEPKEFVDFPNVALYTPISYAPQSLVIALMKRLHIAPVKILYVTRFSMLLLWLATVFYMVKKLPIFQWFFSLIALLPMSLFINMSVSADVVTNILCFLWIGHVFKLAFGDKVVDIKDIVLLFVLSILLSSAKYVYTPSVFLVFLIPASKYFNWSTSKSVLLHLSIIFIAFAVAFKGSSYASHTYIAYADYNKAYNVGIDIPIGVDINGQMAYLKANPKKIIEVVVTGFCESFLMLKNTYIGVLGWLDVRIPMLFIYLGYVSILLVLLYENFINKHKIGYKQRIILLLVSSLMMFLVYLSQYLSWAAVGSEYCGSIQGRYFIPILPLLFLGLMIIPIKLRVLLPLSLVICITVLLGAIQSLCKRYYVFPNKQLEIICDSEMTWRDEYIGEIYFKTNVSEVMLFNGFSKSNEDARSGSYSSKVTPQKNYGATFKLYNLTVGDTLDAEVWYHGEGGELWINSAENNVFLAQNNVKETDIKGWKKLTNMLVIDAPLAMRGTEIGVFVSSKNLCYFDDFKLNIRPAH
jgi:uncharacterized membrane protein